MEKTENPSAEEQNELVDSLYREYFTQLVEKARRCGCSADNAEDIVQEVFQIAWVKAAELYASENRIGWLHLTLRNRIGHNYRAMRYAEKLLEHVKTSYAATHEDHLNLKVVYYGLVSVEELDLIIRFLVHGVPARQIAEEEGISLENCKKRIQRAKAHFFREYKKYIENL